MEGQPSISPGSENQGVPCFSLCPNCKAEMPGEMRFCRMCGYRLGEGVSEFTETVRLPGAPFRPTRTHEEPQRSPTAEPFNPVHAGPLEPGKYTGGPLFSNPDPAYYRGRRGRRAGRFHWALWVVIAVAISGAYRIPFRNPSGGPPFAAVSRSYIGANLGSATNGVLVVSAAPPGGPIDKAGLLGGDVITSFDGKAVQSEKQLRELFNAALAGKTVDVIFIRDGETKITKLTPVLEDEISRLKDAFSKQPGGQGKIGVRNNKQVDVPMLNIKGVMIGSADKNYPANMAGIQAGDIVIAFDGVPIRTAEEFASRILRTTPRSTVTVDIVRGGEQKSIQLTVGET